MDDLVVWLRQQIDEDERIARAAEGSSEFDGTGIVVGPKWSVVLPSNVAAFIARHDPARVLREVEAKRRIVEIHSDMHSCGFSDYDDYDPCPTLRALALPYSDRPGYREEWKP